MAQAPLFTRKGEAELGLGMRVLAPRRGLVASARVAATDHVRVGGVISGAALRHSRDWGSFDGSHHLMRYMALYAEGFVGAEGTRRIFRYGGLVGAGYGASDRTVKRCLVIEDDDGWSPDCLESTRERVEARWLRTYGQLHFGLAPGKIWRGAVGLRVPFDHDLKRAAGDLRVSPEGFMSQSVLAPRARIEVQFLAGQAQGLTIALAVFLRLGPGSRSTAMPPAHSAAARL